MAELTFSEVGMRTSLADLPLLVLCETWIRQRDFQAGK